MIPVNESDLLVVVVCAIVGVIAGAMLSDDAIPFGAAIGTFVGVTLIQERE